MPNTRAKRPPTMREVGVSAGVSVATVSNVLNPKSAKYVSGALRQKVAQAVKNLGYRPNYLARGMRGKNRRTFAILVPQFENVLFTRMVMAIEQVAYDAGYVLLICSTYDNPDREREYIDNLLSQQVDGFLIAPTIQGAVNTRPLRKLSIPYVIIDRQLTGLALNSYNYVGFDNRMGAELATQFLIDHGHWSIGMIGWHSKIEWINERYIGFQDTLVRNGLELHHCPVVLGEHSREDGKRITLEMLQKNQVTALLVGHQYMGEGAMLALHQMGKELPRDISLIVYGRPVWSELTNPPLTCVEMPDTEQGEIAAKILIGQIEENQTGFEQVIFTPELFQGGSVGAGPGGRGR